MLGTHIPEAWLWVPAFAGTTADEHGRSWYQSPSIRLQIFGDVDFRRQRADRGREVDEFLELGLVLVRQLARHVVTHHRHRIDDIFGGQRVPGEVLARLLWVLVDETMPFFQTAAKRRATSGRLLMKSLVIAQPAANALPSSSPRMYLAMTPASSVRATPSLRMIEACGSSV